MTETNPITPTPELVYQWSEEWAYMAQFQRPSYRSWIATQAARWGADQELEACIQWIQLHFDGMRGWCDDLRAARRPKPPSLKEQALETLRSMQIPPCVIDGINVNADLMAKYDILRRALEQLDD